MEGTSPNPQEGIASADSDDGVGDGEVGEDKLSPSSATSAESSRHATDEETDFNLPPPSAVPFAFWQDYFGTKTSLLRYIPSSMFAVVEQGVQIRILPGLKSRSADFRLEIRGLEFYFYRYRYGNCSRV